jgi:hypothetical protein
MARRKDEGEDEGEVDGFFSFFILHPSSFILFFNSIASIDSLFHTSRTPPFDFPGG